ncbi:MAG: hypothetical protein M1840_004631 [Geoglossum simile]|nr:MAG: hypothetical protein M1840_004631 [Geoglossum simile]
MAHEVQFITNTGIWVPDEHLQDPEQTETISDGALLPPVQWNGDIVSRDASGDGFNDVWPFLTSSSIMALGAGNRTPHILDCNGEVEDLCSTIDITSKSQMGQPTAFTPGTVAAVEAPLCEGLDLDVVLVPDFSLVLTHRTRRPKEPPLVDSGQHSEQEWERMKPIIRRMYLEEGKALHDVMDNMDLVYHFQASRGSQSGDSQRILKKGKEVPETVSITLLLCGKDRRDHLSREVPPALCEDDLNFRQHLHRYSKARTGIAAKSSPFTASRTTSLRYSRVGGGWQICSVYRHPPELPIAVRHGGIFEDQCFGVSVLIQSSSMKHAFQTLDRVFQSLKSLAASCDPSIVVKFWPMCHRLHGICVDINNYQLLYEFFRYFRELTMNYFGAEHPVFLLLDALSHVEWDAMISTLRVGYLKSIHCMESVMGTDHAIVLSMWSNYIKYWDKQGLHQAIFMANFTRLLAAADARFGGKSEKAISVLHGFTYAAFYNFSDPALSRRLAKNLLERTREIPHINNEYQWGVESQGFAFASKVLALLCLQENQRDQSQAYLINAISCLENGDRECKTRAVMLAEDLEGWLTSWNDMYSVEALRHRRMRLLSILSDNR